MLLQNSCPVQTEPTVSFSGSRDNFIHKSENKSQNLALSCLTKICVSDFAEKVMRNYVQYVKV